MISNEKVTIYKNPNGDTRTAPKDISFEQFQEANDMHRENVKNVMNGLALKIMITGLNHDHTKKAHNRLYYKNFLSTINEGTDFVNSEWYQYHIKAERHHLLSNYPEDVNLIDILEMIVDCVCSRITRSEDVRPIEINNEILRKALDNTVEYIKDRVIVKER